MSFSNAHDGGERFPEDNFTPTRPPQLNNTNEPPRPVSSSAGDSLSTMGHAGSTPPVGGNETTLITAPTPNTVGLASGSPRPRPHVHYYATLDINAERVLTEQAIDAHNELVNGAWNSNLFEWLNGGSQFSAVDPPSPRNSVLPPPRTQTVARTGTGSSWTIGPNQTLSTQRSEDCDGNVCAIGGLFEEVTYPPNLHLSDEDLS
ncbi:hypothetical protein GGS24DRAFT_411222 [Hypoxylon argillaceum]|nr:hypothetical protein GGS24DRAFT_411222 [Hypoxylon argillaceum]